MEENKRTSDYEFIVDMVDVASACENCLNKGRSGVYLVTFAEILKAEKKLAKTLQPLGYTSRLQGIEMLIVTLTLPENPMGYFWFARDMSVAIVAAVTTLRSKSTHRKHLYRDVYKEICTSMFHAADISPVDRRSRSRRKK